MTPCVSNALTHSDASFSSGGSFFGIILEAKYAGLPHGRYGVGYSIGDGFATPDRHGYYFVGPANEYDDSGTGSARISLGTMSLKYSPRRGHEPARRLYRRANTRTGPHHRPIRRRRQPGPHERRANALREHHEYDELGATHPSRHTLEHIRIIAARSPPSTNSIQPRANILAGSPSINAACTSMRKVGGQYDLFMALRNNSLRLHAPRSTARLCASS